MLLGPEVEVNSIGIGGGLMLMDDDSVNSQVYVDRVVVEISDGSSVERLYFSETHPSVQVSELCSASQIAQTILYYLHCGFSSYIFFYSAD